MPETSEPAAGAADGDGLEGWLRSRLPARALRPKAAAVLELLVSQPRRAAFESAAELGRLAAADAATVTRLAQALGFAGWPALQRELRARYLSSLSAVQVGAAHGERGDTTAAASLARDRENLALVESRLDEASIDRLAEAIAGARCTHVVAAGSYAAVGTALAHNAHLAGYDVRLAADSGAGLANSVAALGPGDLLVAVSFWRLYESTVVAAEDAAARGARVFVMSDAASPALAAAAEEVLLIPAEGVAFFPSLTAGLAAAQAVVARLATVDPERTRAAVGAAEAQWTRLGLLHRPAGAP